MGTINSYFMCLMSSIRLGLGLGIGKVDQKELYQGLG